MNRVGLPMCKFYLSYFLSTPDVYYMTKPSTFQCENIERWEWSGDEARCPYFRGSLCIHVHCFYVDGTVDSDLIKEASSFQGV